MMLIISIIHTNPYNHQATGKESQLEAIPPQPLLRLHLFRHRRSIARHGGKSGDRLGVYDRTG